MSTRRLIAIAQLTLSACLLSLAVYTWNGERRIAAARANYFDSVKRIGGTYDFAMRILETKLAACERESQLRTVVEVQRAVCVQLCMRDLP